ncbi:MAG: hypothetical protein GY859_37825 [Desulfobacterales bacterium]|nr:hypothetical protein [Desulfobacterales bacterium]
MMLFNRKIIGSASIHAFAMGVACILAMAPGVSMADHQLFGPPDASFGLNDPITGQVGAVNLWLVDAADPNSNPVTDPLVGTSFFIEVFIPSWTGNPDATPGFRAEGHLMTLPDQILDAVNKDAVSGWAAPLAPDLGGHEWCFDPSSSVYNEYLALYQTGQGFAIAPIDMDNPVFGENGLEGPLFDVVASRGGGEGACDPDAPALCLLDGRFQVEVAWETSQQDKGVGLVHNGGTDNQGAFWFLDPTNTDLLVKILDGCDINDHFWVFASGGVDVGYSLTVTDTETGVSKEYANPVGQPSPAITDTSAFATCP